MKNFALLFFTILICLPVFGQTMQKQTLSQHGSSGFVYANNKSYYLQQSIGQASVINTFESNNHQLRQGFLQPVKAALVDSGFDTDIEVLIYPNPFQETVYLNFNEPMVDVITLSLHSITGQLLFKQEFDPSDNLSLQFLDLPIGTYVLRGQMRAQTFVTKLIKH